MTESKELFIIAASGTGGHIFPGLFIAQALLDEAKEKGAEVVVEFIGSGRPLEAKLIDSRGYRRHSIAMHGVVGRGLRGTLQAIVNFPIACAKIWKLYSKHRPRVVIGVGGYSSVAPIFVAWLRRIPTWIHEAEARPGLANAVLSIIASKISLSWSECRMWSRRTVITGHPVRQELRKVTPVAKERPENLLILGGSQGARSLDLAALNLAQYFKESGLKVWHQCREENLSMLESHYSEVHLSFRVNTFVDDMAEAYQWSDIILARSGAGTVAEISVINRPAIFIPLPSAQGDHQTANASALERAHKAKIVAEGEDFIDRIKFAIGQLLEASQFRSFLNAPPASSPLDAARKIAQGCFRL